MRIATVVLVLMLVLGAPWAAAEGFEAMLPQVDDGQRELAGWWMSEKLDGVRGYWDGRRLWSKNGTEFHPPVDFVKGLPDFALEGEIWGGHGAFEKTVSIIRRKEPHEGWQELKFAVFDVPEAPGPFNERITLAQVWFDTHPSETAFVIPQIRVEGRVQVREELKRVEALGGEGLILRNPQALYASGRSAEILKVKPFDDAEALVVGSTEGQGVNKGRMGALLVELPNGIRFRVGAGFSAAQRTNPPAPGAWISFRHQGFHSSGIPRFPVFLRVRSDQGL